MQKKVYWTDPTYRTHDPLVGDHETSYLIIGGGIAGLFTAYFLLKKGVRDITILEKNSVGSGSTGHSAGMLVAEIETAPWRAVIERFGETNATYYLRAQKEAQELVAKLIRTHNFECEYEKEDLYLFIKNAWSPKKISAEKLLRREIHESIHFLSSAEMRHEVGSSAFALGERIEKSISVNPLKFAHEMAKYLQMHGVHIYEKTPCVRVIGRTAYTPKGKIIYTRHIIYTRGTAERTRGLSNFITTIGVTRRLSEANLRKLRLSDKHMSLDEEPEQSYHYFKVTKDNRLLVGYGDVRHNSSAVVTPLHMPHVQSIRSFIHRVMGSIPLEYAWSAMYSLYSHEVPLVEVRDKSAMIAGAGTQIASIAVADYAVTTLLGEKHILDSIFKQYPTSTNLKRKNAL